MATEQRKAADAAGSPEESDHRPQALLMSFFGGVVQQGPFPALPTTVFVDLLAEFGVAEAAARATLARMVGHGLLERLRIGRTARYTLTPAGTAVVEQGAIRVQAASPFSHADGEWTLLSYSLPESRRDVRHQLRAALTWAGFGRLRDGLWIAPGVVDVEAVFSRTALPNTRDSAEWFSASPMPGVDVERLVRRVWPVEEIRVQHEAFLARWGGGVSASPALPQITLLGADWLDLLRADPGLPACTLAVDWPAQASTAAYRRRYRALLPRAQGELTAQLDAAVN